MARRLTFVMIVLIWDTAKAQNVLGSMMWPSNLGMNAAPGMAKAVEEPCSTGDLKFGYQWKYGRDFKVPLNRCCDHYRQEGTKCIPSCGNCTNGICKSPSECICNKGFVKRPDDDDGDGGCKSDPLEQCRIACENGFCDAEARCRCKKGFVMVGDGRCREEVLFCLRIVRRGKVCFPRGWKASSGDDVYE